MFSPFATNLTAGATLASFLVAAATPCFADEAPTPPAAPNGSVIFQGPVQVVPATPGAPPPYQGAPQAYPQGYPQGYVAPAPAPYPGYAPAPYPQGALPQTYLIPRGERTPIRYESQPRYGLIVAGAITFGASYLMTAGITGYINGIDSLAGGHGTYWPMYIPVVGPFIYMGVGDKSFVTIASPMFVVSGLAQLGGVAMLIAGVVSRKKVPIYAEDAGRLTVAPYLSPTSSGIQAMGTF